MAGKPEALWSVSDSGNRGHLALLAGESSPPPPHKENTDKGGGGTRGSDSMGETDNKKSGRRGCHDVSHDTF